MRPAALGSLTILAAASLAACATGVAPPTASLATIAEARRDASACAASPLDIAPFTLGALAFEEGIVLDGLDARVGGLSALAPFGEDGFLAVSDQGRLVEIRLAHDDDGRLTAWCGVHALGDAAGRPLDDKADADSEGAARLDDDRLLISFERRHRVQAYSLGADPARLPDVLRPVGDAVDFSHEGLEDNLGLEALAILASGALLAGGETPTLLGRPHPVWRLAPTGDPAAPFAQPGAPDFEISAAPGYGLVSFDVAPNGDVILLQRFYQQDLGNRIAIQRIPALTAETATGLVRSEPLGELTRNGPLPVDNFEGAATRIGEDGHTEIWIISDDNFSASQRTLLYRFSLEEGAP